MNLNDVIEGLVDDRGLNRDKVVDIVCQGVLVAYLKKFPDLNLEVSYNKATGQAEVTSEKTIMASVSDSDIEKSSRRARIIFPKSKIG